MLRIPYCGGRDTPMIIHKLGRMLGFLSLHQFGRLPGEQGNNVVRSSFVLGTPGFILGSPRKLIIHLALLVDSSDLIIPCQLTPAAANTPTTPAAANTPAATVRYRREYD
ncbi:hypothetical protein C8J57DRAFT_1252019 [Mycena rebaudengoi]|nr:hypothetical protein C8J57DRAFT_1252019 [Mycena rebaudengoi]